MSYPGLFASRDTAVEAQVAAARFARRQDDPAQSLADERELRHRMLIRSAVLWAVLGIPILSTIALAVVFTILATFGGAALATIFAALLAP